VAESSSEKTEKPSQKKMRDAREKGQIPRSRDLVVALATLAVTVALTRFGPDMAERLGRNMIGGLSSVADRAHAALTPDDVGLVMMSTGGALTLIVGPLLLIGAVIGLAGNVMQSGWVTSADGLTWKWERLSPAQGIQRLKPSQSGIDLLKTILMATFMTWIATDIVRDLIATAPTLAAMTPADAAAAGWERLMRMMWRCGFVLFALAGGDYAVQRWRHYTSLKMTKQEVRDESKSSDGSPEVKARVRKIQRDMSRRRMLRAVKQATVVVTNPTHFAVALEYHRGKTAAPVVVAKGADHMAARIKKVARDAGVPLVENVSLAQALYKGADVGDVIPSALFGAVAEVLAYLVRIKQLML